MISISNVTTVRVRYEETDKMGIVYNGNYFTYFEVGRTELMRSKGLIYRDLEMAGFYLPLMESYAQYLIPAIYDDELLIEASLKWDREPTLRFDYTIKRQNGDLICKGHTLHCFTSTSNMKPVRPPKIFIDAVNNYNNKAND